MVLRYSTDDARRRAVGICDAHARRLAALLPHHELVLVGASSVVGGLSRCDVDLHMRVKSDDFDLSVALLPLGLPARPSRDLAAATGDIREHRQ